MAHGANGKANIVYVNRKSVDWAQRISEMKDKKPLVCV